MSTRARPASTAAEMAILGSILLDNHHYQQAAAHITAADFSLESHRTACFLRMGELLSESRQVDIVTLAEQFTAA